MLRVIILSLMFVMVSDVSWAKKKKYRYIWEQPLTFEICCPVKKDPNYPPHSLALPGMWL